MKILLTILALFSIAPQTAKATAVTLSSPSTGPSVFASNAVNLVPTGSMIKVGTFLGGIETLANWREFGDGKVSSVGLGGNAKASKVNGTVTNTGGDNAGDDVYNGLAVYIWIYNSVAVSLTADQAIFKSTFVFPVNNTASVADAVTPTAVSFTTAVAIEGFTTGQFIANVDNGTGNLTGGKFVLGAAVPEISTSMMLASLLGLVAIRRRR